MATSDVRGDRLHTSILDTRRVDCLMDKLEVQQLVARVGGRFEILDLFLTSSAAERNEKNEWMRVITYLISQTAPLLVPLFVSHGVVCLPEEVKADVHAGDADKNGVTPSI